MSIAPQPLTDPTWYSGKMITLQGDASERTISLSSQGSLFTVGADVTLVLDNNITLQGRSDNNASLVKVDGGHMVMNNGAKVTGNTYNNAPQNVGGGGIFVSNGSLEITGGGVEGNTATTAMSCTMGGGVYATGSAVIMSGGTIKNNTATITYPNDTRTYGGGIEIADGSYFVLSGGIIEANTAFSKSTSMMGFGAGGGVSVRYSTFKMIGGVIRDNYADSLSGNSYGVALGGGIMIEGDIDAPSIFQMEGGVINGNTCRSSLANSVYGGQYEIGSYGGGVCLQDSDAKITKTGGIIYGNDISGNDAGGIPLANIAADATSGYAVYKRANSATTWRRNTTADESTNLDSTLSGSAGGWE
jgi:hypothetical protein